MLPLRYGSHFPNSPGWGMLLSRRWHKALISHLIERHLRDWQRGGQLGEPNRSLCGAFFMIVEPMRLPNDRMIPE